MTVLTNDQITEIALRNGFKLREQLDGSMALNPYVFDFARDLIKTNYEHAMAKLLTMTPEETQDKL